jgi:hypothetical protein
VTGQHASKDRHRVFQTVLGYGNDSVQNGPFGVASSNGIFTNRDWLAQAVKKPSVAVSIGGRVEIDQWTSQCKLIG